MQLKDAEKLAITLMHAHALNDWHFKFDRAKRRFGCCNYTHKTLSLSRVLTELNDETTVRDVILHEIAHALTPGAGHGRAWRDMCQKIGAKPERTYQPNDVQQASAPYLLRCKHCQREYKRYRKTRRTFYCAPCCHTHNHGYASDTYKLEWVTLKRT